MKDIEAIQAVIDLYGGAAADEADAALNRIRDLIGTQRLTVDEAKVMASLHRTWDLFLALPTEHADDQTEFRTRLHELQRLIMVRPVRRNPVVGPVLP